MLLMTDELANRVRIELRRVHTHLGCWTSEYIEEYINDVIDNMDGEEKQRICLNCGCTSAYPIDVAIDRTNKISVCIDGNNYLMHNSRVLQLLVDEAQTMFAVKNYICYEPDGWDGENVYENESYDRVELDNLRGNFKSI